MTKRVLNRCNLMALMLCITVLSACSTKHVELNTSDHDAILKEDVANITSSPVQNHDKNISVENVIHPTNLTVVDAIKRGVQHNLDARVARLEILAEQGDVLLEQLKALPSGSLSAAFQARTNDGGTSSLSVLSGQQSLEPSQSSENRRRTSELKLTWNVIDSLMAISESKVAGEEAKIAETRYRKVIQNIQRDVYSAYWRALAAQETSGTYDQYTEDANAQVKKIQAAQEEKLISADVSNKKIIGIRKLQEELSQTQNQVALANIELKSLISIPLDHDVALAPDIGPFQNRIDSLLNTDVVELEWTALRARPEIQEEILKKNILWREQRQEIIKTLPGLEFLLSGHYDSNRFLEDFTWGNYSVKIVQSITSLLTYPARNEKTKTLEELADARRQALILAVMAQTRIAHYRLSYAKEQYGISKSQQQAMQRKVFALQKKHLGGFSSGEELLSSRLEYQNSLLRTKIAEAEMHDAFAAMVNTLGIDILSEQNLPLELSEEEHS